MRRTCVKCANVAAYHITNTLQFFCERHMQEFRKRETRHGYQFHRLIEGKDLVHDLSSRRW